MMKHDCRYLGPDYRQWRGDLESKTDHDRWGVDTTGVRQKETWQILKKMKSPVWLSLSDPRKPKLSATEWSTAGNGEVEDFRWVLLKVASEELLPKLDREEAEHVRAAGKFSAKKLNLWCLVQCCTSVIVMFLTNFRFIVVWRLKLLECQRQDSSSQWHRPWYSSH